MVVPCALSATKPIGTSWNANASRRRFGGLEHVERCGGNFRADAVAGHDHEMRAVGHGDQGPMLRGVPTIVRGLSQIALKGFSGSPHARR